MLKNNYLAFFLTIGFMTGPVSAQETGLVGPTPYENITQTWMQPFAGDGFTWGGTPGVHVQSPDRIFVLQRGETRLPDPIPPEYTNFAGSLGWNVVRDPESKVWHNCIYVINSDGKVLEVWDQWDHLFTATEGPGPHRLRISPYDPEKRIWLIDETGSVIYVLSNDGKDLLMTLGEKGVPGTDEAHFTRPQDVTFLPDGTILVADGIEKPRIVIRGADGRYISEIGEAGEAAHQFGRIHSIKIGPNERLYAVDLKNRNVKIFEQTAAHGSKSYPNFQYQTTWLGLGGPLDIIVSDNAAWVSDRRPTKIVKFNLDGSQAYSWLLPKDGPDFWTEMHTMSVDSDGVLYGADNQAARLQKMVPKPNADPSIIIGQPWVSP